MRAAPLQERFDAKYVPEPNSGCWLWSAAVTPSGGAKGKPPKAFYGTILVGRRGTLAHRVSYQLHCGHIPSGMSVLHTCDVPLCVNPEHLFLGTQTDNMRDCVAKGRKIMPSGANHWRHKGKKQ